MSKLAAYKFVLQKFGRKSPMIIFILQNRVCAWVCGWYLLHIFSDGNSLVLYIVLNSYSLKR